MPTGRPERSRAARPPTGTARSLTTDPNVEKVRDELLAKYGNGRKLTAADVAEIQEILIKMDLDWLSKDESIDFFISRKSVSVKRKKLFLFHGLETAFQKEGHFILISKPPVADLSGFRSCLDDILRRSAGIEIISL